MISFTVVKCPSCHGEMLQKNRTRLFVVGLGLIASPALTLISKYLWVPAIIGVLTGTYLIVWAIWGKGLWCRNCKKISLF